MLELNSPKNTESLASNIGAAPVLNHTDCSMCTKYCLRHPVVTKTRRDVMICRGQFGQAQRARFVKAWDRETANIGDCCPEGMFERTASLARSLYRWAKAGFSVPVDEAVETRRKLCGNCLYEKDGECTRCGCNILAKTAVSTERCPLGIWTTSFPPLRRVIKSPVRNLLFHIYPTADKLELWHKHANTLKKHLHLFNGRRIAGIALDDKTLSAEQTKDIFAGVFDEWIEKKNVPTRREGVTFLDMLKMLSSSDDDITFYCHGKGSRHPDTQLSIQFWTDSMYSLLLGHYQVVENMLHDFPVLGSFKRYNQFRLEKHNSWHYSGTFFWFKNKEALSKPNTFSIQSFFAAVEAWPGNVFKSYEAGCVFSDTGPDLYSQSSWELDFLPLLQDRERALCRLDQFSESVFKKPDR